MVGTPPRGRDRRGGTASPRLLRGSQIEHHRAVPGSRGPRSPRTSGKSPGFRMTSGEPGRPRRARPPSRDPARCGDRDLQQLGNAGVTPDPSEYIPKYTLTIGRTANRSSAAVSPWVQRDGERSAHRDSERTPAAATTTRSMKNGCQPAKVRHPRDGGRLFPSKCLVGGGSESHCGLWRLSGSCG